MSQTKPSTRTTPTIPRHAVASQGTIMVKRNAVPTGGGSTVIPAKISYMIIKNVGSTEVRFNFNSDAVSDYWSLAAGVTSPILTIAPATVLNYRAITSNSTAEIILWG